VLVLQAQVAVVLGRIHLILQLRALLGAGREVCQARTRAGVRGERPLGLLGADRGAGAGVGRTAAAGGGGGGRGGGVSVGGGGG
jgi:hypothetical protein